MPRALPKERQPRTVKPSARVMELPAILRYRDYSGTKLRNNVKRDYKQILRNYFRLDPMPFHKRFWEGVLGWGDPRYATDRLPDPPLGRWIINWPTEHAKSTTLDVLYPILSLMSNPDNAHILACSNHREAGRWLGVVKYHLENNSELIRDYPWVKRPPMRGGKKWGNNEFTVDGRDSANSNPSYVAFGWTADDFKGRRGKFVGDDLEGYIGSITSNEREKLYDKIQTEIARCIEDTAMGAEDPFMCIAGTPFDVSSIYFRLEEDHDWKVLRQPYRYSNGNLIWPVKARKIAQLKLSMTKAQFSIAMRLDPTGGDDRALTNDRLRRLTSAQVSTLDAGQSLTFATLDPAGGAGNPRNDYAGICVVRAFWPQIEQWPQLEIERPVAFKEGPMEQVHHLAALCREFATPAGPLPIVYETNGQQANLYRSLFEHLYGSEFQLIRHYTSPGRKYDEQGGLRIIRELAQMGRIKIIERGADPESVRALREEIRDLGITGVHDHLCAAIWFVFRHLYEHFRSRRSYILKPSNPRGGYLRRSTPMSGVVYFPTLSRPGQEPHLEVSE